MSFDGFIRLRIANFYQKFMRCSSSCASCATTTDGLPKGCKNRGSCRSGGCNKLDVFDWLGNMDLPTEQQFPIAEVRFKGSRKGFYRVPRGLDVVTGEPVVVDVPNGHHIGYISLQGELVRLQMKKKRIKEDDPNIRKIYRVATPKDLDALTNVQERESPTMYRTRQIIQEMGLRMKLSDVEFQADNMKATFYYSADERVDFRELIKSLASEFRIRIEMRQISLRQEAGRLGGVGSCGRELCCSTWLTDFKSVTTMSARYQNLSLNPSKLSGQCGRLKCCLNYELQTYMDALKDIPKIERDKPIETQKGKLNLQKTDIFRKIMWFSYEKENTWTPVSVERVNEILALNAKGIKPEKLLDKPLDTVVKTEWQNDLSLEEGSLPNEKSNKRNRRRRQRRRKNQSNAPNNHSSKKGKKTPNSGTKPKPKSGLKSSKLVDNKPKKPKKKPNTSKSLPKKLDKNNEKNIGRKPVTDKQSKPSNPNRPNRSNPKANTKNNRNNTGGRNKPNNRRNKSNKSVQKPPK